MINLDTITAELDLWHDVIVNGATVDYEDFNLEHLEVASIRDAIVYTALAPVGYVYTPGDSLNPREFPKEVDADKMSDTLSALLILLKENVDSQLTHDHLCAFLAYLFWSLEEYTFARMWLGASFERTTMSKLVEGALRHGLPGHFTLPDSFFDGFSEALYEDIDQALFGLHPTRGSSAYFDAKEARLQDEAVN